MDERKGLDQIQDLTRVNIDTSKLDLHVFDIQKNIDISGLGKFWVRTRNRGLGCRPWLLSNAWSTEYD